MIIAETGWQRVAALFQRWGVRYSQLAMTRGERIRRRSARGLAALGVVGFLVLAGGAPAWADTARSGEWHLPYLRIPDAQQITQGDGITVALIDTSVSPDQAELKGAVLTGTDATKGFAGTGQKSDSAHGTGLASLIAGRGRSATTGTLGVAPKAKILPVRVPAGAKALDLQESITWAVRNGAKVICLGVVSTTADPGWAPALEEAFRAGVVVVAPVGDRTEKVTWPAAYPGVVAVAAMDRYGKRASFSATGPEVLLAAPGAAIISPGSHGAYPRSDSTADAAAITAGIVALVMAKYPELPTIEVVNRLTSTATAAGESGRDREYGYGIVHPVSALTQTVPLLSPSAVPTVSALPTPGPPTAVAERPGSRNWPLAGAVAIVVLGILAVLVVAIPDRRR